MGKKRKEKMSWREKNRKGKNKEKRENGIECIKE